MTMYHNSPLREACEAQFAGKLFAYHAVRDPQTSEPPFRLTIVTDGEAGHNILSSSIACGSEREMLHLAGQLNRDHLRLSAATTAQIVMQSMRGNRLRGPLRRASV